FSFPGTGFEASGPYAVDGTGAVNALAVGDFDEDGRPDVVAGTAGGKLGGMLNDPPRPSVSATTATATSVAATVGPHGHDAILAAVARPDDGSPAVFTSAGGPAMHEPSRVTVQLGALKPGTTYRVSVRAANDVGVTEGASATITTPPGHTSPPGISSDGHVAT